MKTDKVTLYRGLEAGPSCMRPDCAANCAYAGACKAQWGAGSRSPALALALAAVVAILAGYAYLVN